VLPNRSSRFPHLRHGDATDLWRVPLHPVAADLLEPGPHDGRRKPVGVVAPDLSCLAATFQAAPLGPHNRVVKGHQAPAHLAAP
jgi:hypothetical protein